MKRIRPIVAVAALAVASSTALLPAASASAASASVPICGGTSIVAGLSGLTMRVPTVGNGTPGKWGCNLLPSDVSGLAPVKRLQIDLNDCYGFDLTIDGEYGAATEAAVRSVQADEGVPQDGDYGPVTIRGGFLYEANNSGSINECSVIAAS